MTAFLAVSDPRTAAYKVKRASSHSSRGIAAFYSFGSYMAHVAEVSGGPGVPPLAPAVDNTIFAATGVRVRRLPVSPDVFKDAKA